VLFASDDDPLNTATQYQSVFVNQQDTSVTYNRRNGVNIVQNVFPMSQPLCRRISFQIKGQNADDNLRIYGLFMAYKQMR
jgi:hypothetical protein